jgi:hypothetical protein
MAGSRIRQSWHGAGSDRLGGERDQLESVGSRTRVSEEQSQTDLAGSEINPS